MNGIAHNRDVINVSHTRQAELSKTLALFMTILEEPCDGLVAQLKVSQSECCQAFVRIEQALHSMVIDAP
jgi:hypothetical protein